MDMRTAGITTFAGDWTSVSARLPDDDTLVVIALNDDDVWTGYRDGDIWRYADARPISAERVTHWMPLPPAPGAQAAAAPLPALPLDEHIRMILGRPNFACIKTAQRLRQLGHRIGRRAEEEQAAVLHLNLTMYLKHGAAWLEHANAYLDGETAQGASEASQVHPRSALPPKPDLVADTMDHAQLQALGQQQKGGNS